MCIICAQRTPDDLLARLDQHLATGGTPPSAANPGDAFWSGYGFAAEIVGATESTATINSLLVGQSAYGTLDSGTDEDWFAIQLVAGQTYDFRLLGFGATFLTDPFLRLRDSAGNSLASNDDQVDGSGVVLTNAPIGAGNHLRDSSFSFTATTTGTYYLEADAFSTETGDYLLTATVDPGGQIFTVDEIAWQLINSGVAFFNSPEGAAFNVGLDGALTVNLTGLTAEAQYLARQALLAWTNVTGIIFSETSGAAEITFDDTDTGAYAQPLYSGGVITSSTVNIGLDWLASFGTSLDSYTFETYIHEIGHALGLGHGGNYNGSAVYGVDNYYLNDSLAWTIMSYMNAYNDEFDFGNPGDVNTYVGASLRYIFTPQIADIIAIQHLYGDNSNAFTGNTTYGYNSTTGVTAIDGAVNSGALMAMTVYDDGGTDTLDFSGYGAFQLITLFEESLSSVLGGTHNLGIARGTVIENAIGGSGDDDIYGNGVANTLQGRNGTDYLYGGGGNDVLIGGVGADVLSGGDGTRDRVQYTDSATGLRVDIQVSSTNTGIAAGDTFFGVEDIYGSFSGDTLLGDSANNIIWGETGNDAWLDGRIGNDTVYGGAGNDVMIGGWGADVLDGGTGTRDRVQYTDSTMGLRVDIQVTTFNTGLAVGDVFVGVEDIYGSFSGDTLLGDTGNNIIWGEVGNDAWLDGRIGNDTVYGGGGNDVLIGGAGADLLDGGAGTRDRVQYTDSSVGLRVDLQVAATNTGVALGDTFVGIEDIFGGFQGDTLAGDGGGNMIWGSAGNDVIDGRDGADTLIGGAGNDTLTGGTGADVFLFETALGATNRDTVNSYSVADDTIQLENAIFTALAATGPLGGTAFVSGTAATTAAHRIIYNSANGQLLYDADGNGAGAAIHFATLTAGLGMAAGEFVVV